MTDLLRNTECIRNLILFLFLLILVSMLTKKYVHHFMQMRQVDDLRVRLLH